MSIFLNWESIPDNDLRLEAINRYTVEVRKIPPGHEASLAKLSVKQSLIRIYAAKSDENHKKSA